MRQLLFVVALVVGSKAKYVERFGVESQSQDEIIDYINNVAKPGWTAGRNFDDERLKQLMDRTNGVFVENDVQFEEKEIIVRDDLPKEFDARTKWPQCESIRTVGDESICGASWAFGVAGTVSDRTCIKGYIAHGLQISVQDLLTCCRTCGYGCIGGYPGYSWTYYHKTGLVTGGPYGSKKGCQDFFLPKCDHYVKSGHYAPCNKTQADTPRCKTECQPGYNNTYAKDKHLGDQPYGVKGVDKIAQEIVDNGPVQAIFYVYEDFLTYKSGVYKHKTGKHLHAAAVRILGFGVENGEDYWLVANNWNEDWGDKGFFKIAKGQDECSIEGMVVAAQPSPPK